MRLPADGALTADPDDDSLRYRGSWAVCDQPKSLRLVSVLQEAPDRTSRNAVPSRRNRAAVLRAPRTLAMVAIGPLRGPLRLNVVVRLAAGGHLSRPCDLSPAPLGRPLPPTLRPAA